MRSTSLFSVCLFTFALVLSLSICHVYIDCSEASFLDRIRLCRFSFGMIIGSTNILCIDGRAQIVVFVVMIVCYQGQVVRL